MSNENWMSSLSEHVRSLSIVDIAIPGSHNTMTYAINRDSKTAPDADSSTRRINYIFPCFVRKWAITQSVDIEEQLKLGVRYFDFRVCQYKEKFYFAHGLFSMEIFKPLEQINEFLDVHPREMVILDFQHFYAVSQAQHHWLHEKIKYMFGSKLFGRSDGPLSTCTLNHCETSGKQIILIYRRCSIELPKEFWPSYCWPTPWPNVCSAKKLQSFLDDSLLTRNPNIGYVSQCIMTPTSRYIIIRCFSSLRNTAKKVDKKLHNWIISQHPGTFEKNEKPTVNVFIADFVNLKDGQFCNWVINLNSCLDEGNVESCEL